MNTFKKAGILATIIGFVGLAGIKLDSDADAQPRTTAGTPIGCGYLCSADMAKFATPVGDGLVVLMFDDLF